MANAVPRYIPGWDCHGLPIEHKALKAIGVHFIFNTPPLAAHPASTEITSQVITARGTQRRAQDGTGGYQGTARAVPAAWSHGGLGFGDGDV